jgi:hypothetical protein
MAWRDSGNTADHYLKLDVNEFLATNAKAILLDAPSGIIGEWRARRNEVLTDGTVIARFRVDGFDDLSADQLYGTINFIMESDVAATPHGSIDFKAQSGGTNDTYITINAGASGEVAIEKPLDMQTNYIYFGTTPAASGDIRLENNTTIAWRNAGNTADETLILSSGDTFVSSANFSATQIQSVQTESDAVVQTFRDDASPTVNDFIGAFRSLGRNSIATIDTYFNIGIQQANITDGAEDTIVLFQAMDGGAANTTILQFTTSSGFVEIQSGYNLAIDTGAKFFLDGGGDTSIRESTPDIMTFEIGSRDMVSVNTTATTFKPSAVANEGGEIILEGEGSNADWNIDNLSANLRFLVNTATTQSAQFANLGAGVCDLIIDAQGKLRIDGVGNGDTYLQETNPDDVDFVVGNQKAFRAQETGSKVNFVVGQAGATLQADTSGFLYIPAITSGGAPSGTPAAYTGKTPIVYDDVNDILYAWNGSAWANVASGGSEVFTWTAAHDAAGFQFNLDGSTMSIIGDITTTNNMQFTVPAADTFDFDITGTGTVMSIQTSNFDLPDDYAITWAADSNKRIEYSITRTSLEISVASTHTIDFIINGATQLEIATDGDLQLQQNAIDFNTDGHSITPSATALAVNTGAITDLINFNTGGTTRFQINGLTDIRVEIPLMLKERAAAVADVATYGQFWVQNTTQMAPMFTDDAGTDFGIGGYKTIDYVIDGGGSAITVGKKGGIIVDFDCEVVEWAILGTDGTTGAIVVDVNRSTYAGFPTTASIAGTELPTITATGNKGEDRTLTSWSDINAGDFVEFEVDSITTLQRVTVALKVRPKGQ